MDSNKLDLTAKTPPDSIASYKAIPENDLEEEPISRPRSLIKSKPSTPEIDGAEEKMLPTNDVKLELSSPSEKQNGDAKLDIEGLKSQFVGLTKEELMKYANDPFWIRLRWFLFITFWLLWGVMLLGAVLIILAAPKCSPPAPKTWWEKGPIVEIEQDIESQEIKALTEKGATGFIIFFQRDPYEPVEAKGAFVELLKKYKDAGTKIIVDLAPGSSSLWFNQSESNDPLYTDYYIWRAKPGDGKFPNNWLTVNNNSSWVYSEKRQEFYYSPHGGQHLNFRNPAVVEAFSNVLRNFTKLGADGFRLRNAPFLLVDPSFDDEVVNQNSKGSSFDLNNYEFYRHTKTENLQDLGPLLQGWGALVKNLTNNGPFLLGDDLTNIEAYKVNNSYVVDLPQQSHLFSNGNSDVADLLTVLKATFESDNITWPLWRVNSSSDINDVVTYLLPGTPLIQQNAGIEASLLKIRESPSIMRGILEFYSVNNGSVLAFIRMTPGNPGILVAVNPTTNRTVVDFTKALPTPIEEVTVQLLSHNYKEEGIQLNLKQAANNIPISAKSALVLSYVPKSKK